MILFGIDKVVKYHLDMPFYVTPFVIVINKAKYDALAPAQKKVIDDHCTSAWAEKIASPWADFEHAGRDKIEGRAGPCLHRADRRRRSRNGARRPSR